MDRGRPVRNKGPNADHQANGGVAAGDVKAEICHPGEAGKIPVDGRLRGWPIYQLFRSHLPFTSLHMAIEIKIRKNEPIDRALRRMKKKLDRENIIKGTRAKRYYEKPCEKRRRKEKVQAFTQMLRRRYAE